MSERLKEALEDLLDAFNHTTFNHAYVKDEKACKKCKARKKAMVALASHSNTAFKDAVIEAARILYADCIEYADINNMHGIYNNRPMLLMREALADLDASKPAITPTDGGWRDIATAPKDGTKILAYGIYGQAVVSWSEDHHDFVEDYKGRGNCQSVCPTAWKPLGDNPPTAIAPGGVCEACYGNEQGYPVYSRPAHTCGSGVQPQKGGEGNG